MDFTFLSQEEYNALSPAEQAKYDKAAAEAIAAFRTANPNGLTVAFTIARMNLSGKDNKIALVVKTAKYAPKSRNNDGFSAFTYTENQVERIAATANIVSSDALFGVIASCIDPCKLEVTVRPVLRGEKYTKADKTEGTYEVTMLRYENDKIVLSEDAQDFLGDIYRDVVKDSVKASFASRRAKAARRNAVVETPVDTTVTP